MESAPTLQTACCTLIHLLREKIVRVINQVISHIWLTKPNLGKSSLVWFGRSGLF